MFLLYFLIGNLFLKLYDPCPPPGVSLSLSRSHVRAYDSRQMLEYKNDTVRLFQISIQEFKFGNGLGPEKQILPYP